MIKSSKMVAEKFRRVSWGFEDLKPLFQISKLERFRSLKCFFADGVKNSQKNISFSHLTTGFVRSHPGAASNWVNAVDLSEVVFLLSGKDLITSGRFPMTFLLKLQCGKPCQNPAAKAKVRLFERMTSSSNHLTCCTCKKGFAPILSTLIRWGQTGADKPVT